MHRSARVSMPSSPPAGGASDLIARGSECARGSESDGDLSPRSSGASSSRVSFNPTI